MRCVVVSCENDSTTTFSPDISFHKFPTDSSLRAAWLGALRESNCQLEDCSAVCSDHFLMEDLETNAAQRKLRPAAVPVADAPVCRICFKRDCKLYPMTTHRILCKAYETLTGLLLQDEVKMPQYLCSDCSRRLVTCAGFKIKSLRAHSVLLELLKKHGHITLNSIQSTELQNLFSTSNKQTDQYELGMEILVQGNVDIDDQAYMFKHVTSFHKDIAIIDVKVESADVSSQDAQNDENTTDKGVPHTSKRHEDFTVRDFKVEVDKIVHQDVRNDKDTTNNDTQCTSKLGDDIHAIHQETLSNKHTTNDVNVRTSNVSYDVNLNEKAGDNVVINQENHNKDSIDNNTVGTSNLNEDFTVLVKVEVDEASQDVNIDTNTANGVTTFIENTVNVLEAENNAIESNVDGDVMRKQLIGEYYSSDDSLPLEEIREKTKQRMTIEQEAEKISEELNASEGIEIPVFKDKLYSCDLCPYKSIREVNWLTHKRAHAAAKCYKCDKCNFITVSKKTIMHHTRVHTGEKPYSCDICNKAYKQDSALRTHLRSHSGEKRYSCDVCNKGFYHASDLKRHRQTHSGEKLYSCEICKKSILRKGDLKTHLRLHSGAKPFSCDVCRKKFTLKSNLHRHMRVHSGEKPYSCSTCNKSFVRNYDLKKHVETHSESFSLKRKVPRQPVDVEKLYTCDICTKSFVRNYDLKRHVMTIHSGEKPYSCEFCSKTFSLKTGQQRHLKTHNIVQSDDKPYSCDICKRTFTLKNSIRRHLKIHKDLKDYTLISPE